MTGLLLLRHGQTDWSRDGRIQGNTDTALSEQGRHWLERRRLPAEFNAWRRFSSPLQRCVQTCQCLGLPGVELESRIVEMDWGAWEGRTLSELRAQAPDAMRENEARGLDFRPQGGESPREVLGRVREWLAELVQSGQSAVAVTHRGVIRVVLAEGFGWDMMGRPPVNLDWNSGHLFRLDAGGRVQPERMNIALEPMTPCQESL